MSNIRNPPPVGTPSSGAATATTSDPPTPPESDRERWENDGGSAVKELQPSAAPSVAEPFPVIDAGELVLGPMELVRLIDKKTIGRYRIQQTGPGEKGHSFLVTLFGATCSKVSLMQGRHPTWRDELAAMKRAIEREVAIFARRDEALPLGVSIEIEIRDTDFSSAGSE